MESSPPSAINRKSGRGGADDKKDSAGPAVLGNQLKSEFGGDRCFGVLANMDFIMICTYEAGGANPELVLYKKR